MVALLDVIPMIGATLGAIVVCAIAAAVDLKTGIFCVIFYIVYQQLENYLIYPRVMSKSVDIPGVMTVIAALIGASLLGVDRRPAGDPDGRGDPAADARGRRTPSGRVVALLSAHLAKRRSTSTKTSGCCECTQWPAPLTTTRRWCGNQRRIASVFSGRT